MVVGGIDLVHKLGVTKKELFPVTSGIKAAKSEGLKLIRGLLVTIYAVGTDSITRSDSHMCYISENLTRMFLSKKACCDLGIVGENFPEVGSTDHVPSVNKCELVDTSVGWWPNSCKCPKRARTPRFVMNI